MTLGGVKYFLRICRRKVIMSGLSKVEMSSFIRSRRADERGANRVGPERAGAAEGTARSRAGPSEAGGSQSAAGVEHTAGAADSAAGKGGRRRGNRTPLARTTVESEDSGGAARAD